MHRIRALRAPVAVAVLAGAVAFAADTPGGASFLDAGMRQVADGDFESAVFSLDTAVRKLQSAGNAKPLLVRAYLWLGAAYVGLDYDTAASAKFREALSLDASVRPSDKEFPPRVLKLFDEELAKLTAKKSTRKRKVAIVAAGAAAATGIVVAAKAAPIDNRPPSAGIGVLPPGAVISWVTEVRLWANASDPEGGSLTYAWDFGDGSTGQGQEVTHVFQTSRPPRTCVTVRDPEGAETQACESIPVTDLSGTWSSANDPITCVQSGGSLACQGTGAGNCHWWDVAFTFATPRRVATGHIHSIDRCLNYDCNTGELTEDGRQIQCLSQYGPTAMTRQ